MASDDRQQLVTERVWDFLRYRAMQDRRGIVRADLATIMGVLARRHPCERRPTVGEVHEAMQSLHRSGRITVRNGHTFLVKEDERAPK